MNIATFLQRNVARLQASGITTARLDCLVLLEDTLGINRANILAHPEQKIHALPLLILNKKIAQRAKHVPLAYIRKHAPFYGREFIISKNVLVPRPESEDLIDLVKPLASVQEAHILDVGTGSGCLGITLKLEIPSAKVTLADISPSALTTAKKNAHALHAHVNFVRSNLLANVSKPPDIIVTNLPYVPTDYPINKAATHEPSMALFGGTDGLDIYRSLFAVAKSSYAATEAMPTQHAQLARIAASHGYKLIKTSGYAQLFKSSEKNTN